MPTAIPLSHVDWQAQVVDLAHALGWDHLHVRRTVGRGKQWTTSTNVKGWPDLFLWHHRHGFAAIELKVGKDTATVEQQVVLAQLAAAGAAVMVAYPSDFERLQIWLRTGVQPAEASTS